MLKLFLKILLILLLSISTGLCEKKESYLSNNFFSRENKQDKYLIPCYNEILDTFSVITKCNNEIELELDVFCNSPNMIEKELDKVACPERIRAIRIHGEIIVDSLPVALSRCVNLEYLDLSASVIKYIPDSFRKLQKLRILHFEGSAQEQLPINIELFENLEEIYLNNNHNLNFSKTLKTLSNFKKLDGLYFGGCGFKIDTLPREIGLFKHVEYLSLAGNRINIIPDEIWKLKKLKGITYSGNPEFPKNFLKKRKLRILQTPYRGN